MNTQYVLKRTPHNPDHGAVYWMEGEHGGYTAQIHHALLFKSQDAATEAAERLNRDPNWGETEVYQPWFVSEIVTF